MIKSKIIFNKLFNMFLALLIEDKISEKLNLTKKSFFASL